MRRGCLGLSDTGFVMYVQGIETVRRDGCPAVVKIQERAMRTLFDTSDLSAVRAYLQRQWTKILAGRVSLQDFVFAKEASGCAPCCCRWRADFCMVMYTGAGWQSMTRL